MKAIFKKGQRLYIVFAIAIVVIATVALTVTALASGPDTDRTALPVPTDIPADAQNPPPPPDSGAPTGPIPTPSYYGTDRMIELQQKVLQATTDEERAAAYKELTEERIRAGDIIPITYTGPSTRGSTIQIAGKTVQLPDDAELGGIGMTPQGAPNPLGQPVYDYGARIRIIRGDSEISVGIHSGIVMSGWIAPGEEDAFDFLKEYFPDQSTFIDSLPMMPKITLPLSEVSE